MADKKTPVTLVTGFLGSGQTTLIARLLAHPRMGETAVIVNELGDVSIDHHLLRQVDERTVVLAGGCVCCTLRSDLADELRDLAVRRQRGEIPTFRRVLVETTGIADPTPLVYTLLSDPLVQHRYVLDSIVSTVDAEHGLREPESVKQAAVADVLVVTKVDLADPAAVDEHLRALNPAAEVVHAAHGEVEPELLFGRPQRGLRDLHVEEHPPDHEVRAVCLLFAEAIEWTGFALWLTMLLEAHGEDLIRIKGVLDVGESGPVLLNAVQHVVYPLVHLDGWADHDHRSRLVLIGRGIDRDELERSLQTFNALALRVGSRVVAND